MRATTTTRLARAAVLLFLSAALAAAASCHRVAAPDAYGNVEATEVVVSAEASGRLLSFPIEEGRRLEAGAVVGQIDSTPLTLERDQLTAERAASASRGNEIAAQAQVLEAQRAATEAQQRAATSQRAALQTQQDIAQRAYERTQRLFAQQAATSQQLDQAEQAYRVLQDQVAAQDQQIASQGQQVDAQARQIAATGTQGRTAAHQTSSIDAQIAQVDDRIAKTRVTNPVGGTVLVTYARAGELVQPGTPLYSIADLTSVDVRAYLTEPQLASVHLGDAARITVDAPGGRQTLSGTVTWISSQSEFTPTPIQTRDERADLVYAIKIRVSNPSGVLKIGMPVDVTFVKAGGAS